MVKQKSTKTENPEPNVDDISDKVQPEYIDPAVKASDQAEQYDLSPPKIQDNGRFVYWGLALLLLAFIGVAGYQIYKYELGPEPAVVIEDQPEPAQTVFNPEVISPETPEITNNQPEQNKPLPENRTISRQSDEQRREFYEGLYQEEEVQRRVEEELEALKLQEQAQAQKLAEEKQQNLDDLLNKASQAVSNAQLLSPEGESAFDYYSQVLQIQPENNQALSGINEIADNYFNLAVTALENKDPDSANSQLKRLIQVRPDDPRLDGFLQQITDLKAQIKLEKAQAELEQQLKAEQEALLEKQKLAEEKLAELNAKEKLVEKAANESLNNKRSDSAYC